MQVQQDNMNRPQKYYAKWKHHEHHAKWKQVTINTIERASQLTGPIFNQPTVLSLDISFPFQSSLL